MKNIENILQTTSERTLKMGTKDLDQFVNQRIVQLQKQLLEKELEIDNLLKQNENKSASNKQKLLEIKLETLQSENQQLKNQLGQYEVLNKTLQRKCESFSTQLEHLTGLLDETQQLLEHERQNKQDLQQAQHNTREDVQQEMTLIRKQLDMLRRDKASAQQQAHESEQKLVQSEQLNTQLGAELLQLRNSLQSALQRSQECSQTNAQLESKVQQLELQIKSQGTASEELRRLRSQVVEQQKKQSSNEEAFRDIEGKLRMQTEHALKLQNILNEKTQQIQKYESRFSQIETLEEDNSMLQCDLEKMQQSIEDMQIENQRIAKYQQNKIQELKRELQVSQGLKDEIAKKEDLIRDLRKQIESFCSQKDEITNFKEQAAQWEKEKDGYQRKIAALTDEMDKICKQQFDHFRIQLETQLSMRHNQDKIQLENHIWQITSQVQELQQQLDFHISKNSQLTIEIDQLREQLNEKQVNSKTILLLEGQTRNQCIEMEKLKVMLHQKTEEVEGLRGKLLQLQGCANYASELERKVQSLMADNQRLNGIVFESCKRAW